MSYYEDVDAINAAGVRGDRTDDSPANPATPWVAKGDLQVGTGLDAATRLPVGTNGKVLTADSAETAGVKWATPSDPAAWDGALPEASQTAITTGGPTHEWADFDPRTTPEGGLVRPFRSVIEAVDNDADLKATFVQVDPDPETPNWQSTVVAKQQAGEESWASPLHREGNTLITAVQQDGTGVSGDLDHYVQYVGQGAKWVAHVRFAFTASGAGAVGGTSLTLDPPELPTPEGEWVAHAGVWGTWAGVVGGVPKTGFIINTIGTVLLDSATGAPFATALTAEDVIYGNLTIHYRDD